MSNGLKLCLLAPLLVLCLDVLVAPFTGKPAVAATLCCGALYLLVLLFPQRVNLLGRSLHPVRDWVCGVLSSVLLLGLVASGIWATQ